MLTSSRRNNINQPYCILVLPVFDGLTHFNPFSCLSSIPMVFQLQIKKICCLYDKNKYSRINILNYFICFYLIRFLWVKYFYFTNGCLLSTVK